MNQCLLVQHVYFEGLHEARTLAPIFDNLNLLDDNSRDAENS